MKCLNCLGLFADSNGYSITVVEINEAQSYCVVDEAYNIQKVSIIDIFKFLEEFRIKYKPDRLYMTNLPPITQKVSPELPITILELNIPTGVFFIKALQNDGLLEFEEKLFDSLISDLNNFDPEIVNHRCYSLFLAVQESKFYELRRMHPIGSYSQGMSIRTPDTNIFTEGVNAFRQRRNLR